MSQSSSRMTRRRFALGAAVAATTVFLPGGEVSAHELSEASNPPVQQPSSSTKLSPDAQAEVEMKVKEIFRKYGKRLNDEQRADIRKVMAETQGGLEKMRAFALENGDQPATVVKFTEGENHNGRA